MSRRVGSRESRISAVAAWLVACGQPPACSCDERGGHDSDCARLVWLELRRCMEHVEVQVPTTQGMRLALRQLERGTGDGGGFAADWKGAGMDPQVDEWFRRELARLEAEREKLYRIGRLPECARLKAQHDALRRTRKMLHHLAEGAQVVDMTHTDEAAG